MLNLLQPHQIIVDEEDVEFVQSRNWFLLKWGTAHIYTNVRYCGRNYVVFLHHCIAGRHPELITEHINENPFDNRRANLRFATQSQHRRKLRLNAYPSPVSDLPGISWDRRARRWVAQVLDYEGEFCRAYFCSEYDAAETMKLKHFTALLPPPPPTKRPSPGSSPT
jgi:hypothetical protein